MRGKSLLLVFKHMEMDDVDQFADWFMLSSVPVQMSLRNGQSLA